MMDKTVQEVLMKGNTLTVEAAAQRLGVSKFTVRSWLRQRRIAFYRCGRRVVLDEADVEAFLRANRVEARDGMQR